MNIGYIIQEAATTTTDIKVVSDKGNRLVCEGIVQDLEVKNRNGRYYSAEELVPQLTCERTRELLSTGNMKGENGHPSSKDITRQQTIDPMCVCVKFLKFWMKGNDVMAQFKGTNNQLGEEFNNDIIDGEKPSFSLRALGSIENTKRGAEVKNTTLITYDRVYYPSHKRAYMTNIVSESAGIVDMYGNKLTIEENNQGLLIPITNESVINYIKSTSNNFKSIKESFDLFYDSIELLENGKQIQLTDKAGSIIIVNLENYISNEIMDYCYKL